MLKFDEAIFTGYIKDFGIIDYKNKTYFVSLSDITSDDPQFQLQVAAAKKEWEEANNKKERLRKARLKKEMFATLQERHKAVQYMDENVYAKAQKLIFAKREGGENTQIINPGDSVYLIAFLKDTVFPKKTINVGIPMRDI